MPPVPISRPSATRTAGGRSGHQRARPTAKVIPAHQRRHGRVAVQEEPADTGQDVELHTERRQNQGYARSAQERGAPGAGLGTRCREAGVEGWQHAEQQHEPDQREIVRRQPPRRRHRSARPGQGLGWRPRIEGEERSHEWECSKGETRESEGHGCPSHRGLPPATSSQLRSAWSARSYEGIEHPAKPTAARRSWPRWSSTRYSITWSARTRIDGGIVKPSALYSSERSPAQETKRRREKRSRGGHTWRPGAC